MPDINLALIVQQFTSIGGPVVLALVVISIVATATSLSKAVEFSRLGVGSHRRAEEALAMWASGDRKSAFDRVERHKAALSRVACETMRTIGWMPADPDAARDNGIACAAGILAKLGRRIRLLETIVQAAPMLGLLGTVLGMISAFSRLARNGGAGDPGQLAEGIWIALSTTAMGLAIAIPFYFVANWFEERIERERVAMESAISRLLARSPRLVATQTAAGPGETVIAGTDRPQGMQLG